MAPELTPQSIRDIRFREKLRGYHPEDVDTFVADVAATVESLQRRIDELSSGAAPAPDAAAQAAADSAAASTDVVPAGHSEVEESLRRTLILAQRTADLAVKEAQEEAARLVAEAEARRAEVLAEVEETRTRTMNELEHELSGYRHRLYDERESLQRDVAALQAYVAQERERLRIYYSQQLEQLQGGVPGIEAPPAMETADRVFDDEAQPVAELPAGDDATPEEIVADTPGLPTAPAGGDDASAVNAGEAGDEDDPFLAELRRAVNDDAPLGPRDEEASLPERNERDLDIFNDDDGGGRFLRRRR
ncbi:MAG TPA: DivIVA domain-containing protein [Acidimicrobiales bacterium]|jgi:DivIVA domain-containing protein|nr:DivIVA domain-containing protein [Acidimicrobiales bacterium]